eukprot:PhF_6_TR25290/c2_g3_i1/m.34890
MLRSTSNNRMLGREFKFMVPIHAKHFDGWKNRTGKYAGTRTYAVEVVFEPKICKRTKEGHPLQHSMFSQTVYGKQLDCLLTKNSFLMTLDVSKADLWQQYKNNNNHYHLPQAPPPPTTSTMLNP